MKELFPKNHIKKVTNQEGLPLILKFEFFRMPIQTLTYE